MIVCSRLSRDENTEEFGGGEVEDAVVLGDDEEAVLGPAHAVGHLEVQAGREGLHLIGLSIGIAVGHRPYRGLARADEDHVRAGCDRHVARIGHHRKQLDLEARRQPR
ncbi:MAG: hypothetical protein H0U56_00735 [Methylibium sp.]|nr:hypothetical protein [Methylibium sp.]